MGYFYWNGGPADSCVTPISNITGYCRCLYCLPKLDGKALL